MRSKLIRTTQQANIGKSKDKWNIAKSYSWLIKTYTGWKWRQKQQQRDRVKLKQKKEKLIMPKSGLKTKQVFFALFEIVNEPKQNYSNE